MPRVKVVTLGVSNLQRSLAFYRDGLGLTMEVVNGTESEDGVIVFFNMNDDLILALYPNAASDRDARIPVSTSSPAGFSIRHNVSSRQEVDAVMQQAENAGARIIDPAHDRFWGGYSGYFQDLDGHCWETSWNPAWVVKE